MDSLHQELLWMLFVSCDCKYFVIPGLTLALEWWNAGSTLLDVEHIPPASRLITAPNGRPNPHHFHLIINLLTNFWEILGPNLFFTVCFTPSRKNGTAARFEGNMLLTAIEFSVWWGFSLMVLLLLWGCFFLNST